MSVVTADAVRRHLGGIAPYVSQLGLADEAALYDEAIAAAEANFERATRVLLSPKTIRTRPRDDEEYDIADDPYTLHRAFSRRPVRIQLRWRPVLEVLSVRLEFDRDSTILDVPLKWVRLDKRLGVITIVPFGAAAPAVAAAGASMWLPVLGRSMWPGDAVPQLVAVDYRAGYENAAEDPALADVRDCLARDAAWRVLEAVRSLVPNSVSLDGFTQNFDTVQQRIEQLQKDVQAFLDVFRRRERPLVVGVL